MKKILLLSLIVLAFISSNAQTFNPNLAKKLQDTLDGYVSMFSNTKGMSASVYVPGQGVWSGTSGLSYAGQPITPEMEFGIASNSKLFTATAILILAENKTLTLDDSLVMWLPSFINVSRSITIRQLLNHTSGLSDPFSQGLLDTVAKYPTKVYTPKEVLSHLGAPISKPGAGYYYSNINYILAGMVVESASSIPISKFIRDSILTPLGLNNTFYDIEEPAIGTLAHRWNNNVDYHDTSRISLNTSGGAAGSIFSTSGDMVKWYNALFSGEILNSASLAEMTNFLTPGDYGLGISKMAIIGRTLWGHGGSTIGYKSRMFYDPAMKVAVSGLSNSFPSAVDGITAMLYKVLFDNLPAPAGNITGFDTVCPGFKWFTYEVPQIPNATSYIWTLPNGYKGSSTKNTIDIDFGGNAKSGIIEVRGLNSYGEGVSSSIAITVNPIPPKPIVTRKDKVLHSDAPEGNQWYNSKYKIEGATGQDYTVTVTDEYYTVVTLLMCSSAPSDRIKVDMNGIEEIGSNCSIQLYPNPVSDELKIVLNDNNENLDFEILNSLGQVILKGNLIENQVIKTSHFPSGLYLIKIENGITLEIKKFIKE